ncbi:hypothetical protein D039_3846, partial [Vibrio parahaemolyticus EKP-028]
MLLEFANIKRWQRL